MCLENRKPPVTLRPFSAQTKVFKLKKANEGILVGNGP